MYGKINARFLAIANTETSEEILASIATHYGISIAEAYVEVTADGAEHLLDYMVGNQRSATSLLMKRHA